LNLHGFRFFFMRDHCPKTKQNNNPIQSQHSSFSQPVRILLRACEKAKLPRSQVASQLQTHAQISRRYSGQPACLPVYPVRPVTLTKSIDGQWPAPNPIALYRIAFTK
jgi:hypothetical protein